MKKITEAIITYEQLRKLNHIVPIPIQIRFLLNDQGIKFQDDKKPSAIFNDHPIPIGILTREEDFRTCDLHYRQEILV